MELYLDSINGVLLGPLRLAILGVGFYLLYRGVSKKPFAETDLDFAFVNMARYTAGLILILFILIFIKAYDFFTLFLLFMVFLGVKYLNLRDLRNLSWRLKQKKMPFLAAFFHFVEKGPDRNKFWDRYGRSFWEGHTSIRVIVLAFIAVFTFVSRYLFLKFDLYTLSSLWLENLARIKNIHLGVFTPSNLSVKGEEVLIDFYAKITGISPEVALGSFGLLEHVVLALVLYWFTSRLTGSKYVLPFTATALFALGYGFLPIDIHLLYRNNEAFLALGLAIPLVYAILFKVFLDFEARVLFITGLILGLAITNISLVVGLIVIPLLFITVALLWYRQIKAAKSVILGYTLGVLGCLLSYFVLCYVNEISFYDFLLANLMQVNTYSDFPQLTYDLNQLLQWYDWMSWAGLLVLLPLYFKDKKKWTPTLIFMVWTTLLLAMRHIDLIWLDVDILVQCLPWFLVIQFTLLLRLGTAYVSFLDQSTKAWVLFRNGVLLFILFSAIYFGGKTEYNIQEKEPLKKEIIKAYNHLSLENLPFSYGVVNQGYGLTLAQKNHHFMGYQEFLDTYLQRDAIYVEVKEDKTYLSQYPEAALPASIFVFVSKPDASIADYGLVTPTGQREAVEKLLNNLRNKGRQLETFFEDDNLKVYEIINKENSSRLNDLIFNL